MNVETPSSEKKIRTSSYVNSPLKRSFDLIFTIIVLPIALLFLVLILLIFPFFGGFKFFFSHYRVGKDENKFLLYKIRSLNNKHNDPRAGNNKDDGTVIPFLGHFIRNSRIDELPQIWNIIKGDMSWVGPRPEQLAIVEDFNLKYPNYKLRHLVKPGITGFAQINNPNATIDDFQEKLNYDFHYIENASLLFDLKILIQSLIVITKQKS